MILLDLPSLQSIELGFWSLCGHFESLATRLIMRGEIFPAFLILLDIPNLESIVSTGFSFCRCFSVYLESSLLSLLFIF